MALERTSQPRRLWLQDLWGGRHSFNHISSNKVWAHVSQAAPLCRARCVCTLPPRAELTAGARNAALAGSGCTVKAICAESVATRSERVVRAELLALTPLSGSCSFEK